MIKIEGNEKEIKACQLYYNGDRDGFLALQGEFLDDFHRDYLNAGVDHCPCKSLTCAVHGNCVDCIAIHRAHQEHVPQCLRPVINKKLISLSELTENTIVGEIINSKQTKKD